MTTSAFDLPREVTIVLIARELRAANKSVERYQHRPQGALAQGRADGLRTALFFVSDVPHEKIELLVDKLAGEGVGPLDAEEVASIIELVKATAVTQQEVNIPSL